MDLARVIAAFGSMEPELATGYTKVWINLLLLMDSYCYDHVDKEMIDRTDIHEKGKMMPAKPTESGIFSTLGIARIKNPKALNILNLPPALLAVSL